jgi:hypothetical protein
VGGAGGVGGYLVVDGLGFERGWAASAFFGAL